MFSIGNITFNPTVNISPDMEKEDIITAYSTKLSVATEVISKYASAVESKEKELYDLENRMRMDHENELATNNEKWKAVIGDYEKRTYLFVFLNSRNSRIKG